MSPSDPREKLITAEEAQQWLDAATQPNAQCTGVAAGWCPVHGDCICPRATDRNNPLCPLHSVTSMHAEGDTSSLHDHAEALARTVIALHADVARLTRERDAAVAEARGLRADADVWRGAAEITAEDGKSYMRATDDTIAHLRTALDAVAHAHERDLVRLARALGFDHEPPSDLDAMVAEVERLRASIDGRTAAPTDAEIDAARRERDAALAIIEGRTVPPTDEEIDAHSDGGGFWRMAGFLDMGDAPDAKWYAASHRRFPSDDHWWPLDRDGKPCAWPKVTP